MNKVILMGRLTRNPEVRYSQGENSTAVARYTLAVDRRFSREGQQSTDFISCVSFGKAGEFIEKYGKKGVKLVIEGRIQTGSYEKDGTRIYTTDVVTDNIEFAESKSSSTNNDFKDDYEQNCNPSGPADGFVPIPDGIDEELPFN